KTSAYSLSYAGLAEAYDASQAEIRAGRLLIASTKETVSCVSRGSFTGLVGFCLIQMV
ncbi:DUF4946 domain-containing protein, partial [Pseudomonas aeruginosa]|uniref:DUF4946 domain-containing protein n=1 Tax=Pseudomonas aeruginosa TaxID=287 RepID=UPI003D18B656